MSITQSVKNKLIEDEINSLMDLAISDSEEFHAWVKILVSGYYDELSRTELMEHFVSRFY